MKIGLKFKRVLIKLENWVRERKWRERYSDMPRGKKQPNVQTHNER